MISKQKITEIFRFGLLHLWLLLICIHEIDLKGMFTIFKYDLHIPHSINLWRKNFRFYFYITHFNGFFYQVPNPQKKIEWFINILSCLLVWIGFQTTTSTMIVWFMNLGFHSYFQKFNFLKILMWDRVFTSQ